MSNTIITTPMINIFRAMVNFPLVFHRQERKNDGAANCPFSYKRLEKVRRRTRSLALVIRRNYRGCGSAGAGPRPSTRGSIGGAHALTFAYERP